MIKIILKKYSNVQYMVLHILMVLTITVSLILLNQSASNMQELLMINTATKAAEAYAANAEGPMLLGDENGFSMPEDYMRWVPTCHHNHNLVDFGKKFMALTKKQYLYMMYVWGHSFEFERNNNWEIIEASEMIANRDDIWYANQFLISLNTTNCLTDLSSLLITNMLITLLLSQYGFQ